MNVLVHNVVVFWWICFDLALLLPLSYSWTPPSSSLVFPTVQRFVVGKYRRIEIIRQRAQTSKKNDWISLSFPPIFGPKRESNSKETTTSVKAFVKDWIRAINECDIDAITLKLADNVQWDDYSFNQICDNKESMERRLRLQREQQSQRIEIDDVICTSTDNNNNSNSSFFKVGIKYRRINPSNTMNDDRSNLLRGMAILDLIKNNAAADDTHDFVITKATWVTESLNKSGETGLRILSLVGKILFRQSTPPSPRPSNQQLTNKVTKMSPPEQYFAAWNARDMEAAVQLFDDDICYDDAAFPIPFQGREKLQNHLNLVAQCLPASFSFVVHDVLYEGEQEQPFRNNKKRKGRYIVQWHVENNGKNLPFSRGMSYYTTKLLNGNREVIDSGLDLVEPDPPKMADLSLTWNYLQHQFQTEPIRWLPLVTWIAYVYIVFFSDNILTGANALQLEQRTWEEVRDLSLNFFLVAPTLGLSFSPVVHPLLESVFNVLLAWAALFAGFLADDQRRDKPNSDLALAYFPTVVGMQFLTSAFLLPYLTFRSSETRTNVKFSEISKPAQIIGESRIWGPAISLVGTYAIYWGIFGRYEVFGELSERWTSFIDLLSIDRVGSSFLVDLAIFALFQNWLIDDDLKRRGVKASDLKLLRQIGKFVPFFGLALYLALRPPLLQTEKEERQIVR